MSHGDLKTYTDMLEGIAMYLIRVYLNQVLNHWSRRDDFRL